MKAGNLLEMQGNYPTALEIYNRLKNQYPESNEGRNADKFIARVGILMSNWFW